MSDTPTAEECRAIIVADEPGRGRTNTALQLLKTWGEMNE